MDTKTEPAYYVDQAKRQVEIPADLIDLRRRWVAADREHTELCQGQPTNRAVRDGAEPAPGDVIDQVGRLRGQMQGLVLQIRAHEWWGTVDNAYLAERAVWAAAGRSAP